MHLTLGDKLRIFLGDVSFSVGVVFGIIGVLLAVFFVPAVGVDGLWFIFQPTAQVAGTITSASPTDYSESEAEDVIWEIDYRFKLAGKLRQSHSYSSSQTVQPGTAIQIEYVKDKPSLSRIVGTSTAPFPPWGLIPVIGVLMGGFQLARKGAVFCSRAIAIAADVFVVSAICDEIKPDTSKTDEEVKGYIARYAYQFHGRTHEYLCEVSSTDLKKFGKQENLALQGNASANAMLVAQLPRLVRDRLRLPANNIQ
ncbi:DUF3592 domain-containing protein [Hymenobacter convexus]|uniref:DUF3592 domain-containing protein n=1 Tax=Hymenobacter sp. CA1UV-4 TaxID=3063782 RepID=UPI002712C772|nr:DUF3592 domain-containing protein [Hymenobacter sp. CA1UV-4]MDO7853757.1 hypothetical protein [Hymenobacter sp. CA1UV-4]